MAGFVAVITKVMTIIKLTCKEKRIDLGNLWVANPKTKPFSATMTYKVGENVVLRIPVTMSYQPTACRWFATFSTYAIFRSWAMYFVKEDTVQFTAVTKGDGSVEIESKKAFAVAVGAANAARARGSRGRGNRAARAPAPTPAPTPAPRPTTTRTAAAARPTAPTATNSQGSAPEAPQTGPAACTRSLNGTQPNQATDNGPAAAVAAAPAPDNANTSVPPAAVPANAPVYRTRSRNGPLGALENGNGNATATSTRVPNPAPASVPAARMPSRRTALGRQATANAPSAGTSPAPPAPAPAPARRNTRRRTPDMAAAVMTLLTLFTVSADVEIENVNPNTDATDIGGLNLFVDAMDTVDETADLATTTPEIEATTHRAAAAHGAAAKTPHPRACWEDKQWLSFNVWTIGGGKTDEQAEALVHAEVEARKAKKAAAEAAAAEARLAGTKRTAETLQEYGRGMRVRSRTERGLAYDAELNNGEASTSAAAASPVPAPAPLPVSPPAPIPGLEFTMGVASVPERRRKRRSERVLPSVTGCEPVQTETVYFTEEPPKKKKATRGTRGGAKKQAKKVTGGRVEKKKAKKTAAKKTGRGKRGGKKVQAAKAAAAEVEVDNMDVDAGEAMDMD